jgi:hypothetical protein
VPRADAAAEEREEAAMTDPLRQRLDALTERRTYLQICLASAERSVSTKTREIRAEINRVNVALSQTRRDLKLKG